MYRSKTIRVIEPHYKISRSFVIYSTIIHFSNNYNNITNTWLMGSIHDTEKTIWCA